MKPDPTALAALALSGALPDAQAGEILSDIFSPVATEQAAPALPNEKDEALRFREFVAKCDPGVLIQPWDAWLARAALATRLGTADLPKEPETDAILAEILRCRRVIGNGDSIDHKRALDDFAAALDRAQSYLAPDAPAQPQPLNQAEPVEGASALPSAEPASQPDAGEQAKIQRQTTQAMADCMDMVRADLIEMGIIDKTVAPMFIPEAVAGYLQRLKASLTVEQPPFRAGTPGDTKPADSSLPTPTTSSGDKPALKGGAA